jgi:FkbM family methyltransferase
VHPLRRTMAFLGRRLGRPELLAAVYAPARQAQLEQVGIAAVLAAALAPDGTYVDVGANRGQVLGEAVRVAPRGRHVAFEPIPALAAQVRRSFPQVDCRGLAIAAQPGQAEFCHFRKLDGWSGLRRSREISDERGDPEFITVQVSTLDEQLAGVAPAVLKIDVEGAELEVLQGARALLARARPLIVFEHVNSAAAIYEAPAAAPWDLLDELGYEIFAVTGEGPVDRAAFAANETVVNWLARPVRDRAPRPAP